MSAVAVELEDTLRKLDSASADSLERLVRDVLDFAKHRQGDRLSSGEDPGLDDHGYPVGHFARLTGSWADAEFELPDDPGLPWIQVENWME
jgi:hypothetical protein